MSTSQRRLLRISLAVALVPFMGYVMAEGVPWPQLSRVSHGFGWIDLERGERIDFLVTVWKDCRSGSCSDEVFVHWVTPRDDRSLRFLETKPVAEINKNPAVPVLALNYVTKSEFPGHFELVLGGAESGKKQQLRLFLGRRGEYTIQASE